MKFGINHLIKRLFILPIVAALMFGVVSCGSSTSEDLSMHTEAEAASVEMSAQEAHDAPASDGSASSTEEIAQQIVQHYTQLYQPEGHYTCFDSPESGFEENEDSYTFVLRYARSEEEMQELMEAGGTPAANVYVMSVYVEKSDGKVTDEYSDEEWYLSE